MFIPLSALCSPLSLSLLPLDSIDDSAVMGCRATWWRQGSARFRSVTYVHAFGGVPVPMDLARSPVRASMPRSRQEVDLLCSPCEDGGN
ncbi:hypothetical protein PVAP13_5NG110317 [Panicum virgatum]|uniref:Secreted protein n=1 Tax=Panicum virgatum TaxID=38727 RepID=A0A8T0S3J0_PANVG|nr:hypothetical protein PVAP13_5NG110317 [Panicum virgatum]